MCRQPSWTSCGQSCSQVKEREQSCPGEGTWLRRDIGKGWVDDFPQSVVPVAEALCLSNYIASFCASKIKLFCALQPYKGKLCNKPNNVAEEYLLTGKMYTRILLSAEKTRSFPSSNRHPLDTSYASYATHTWGHESGPRLPPHLQSGYELSGEIPLRTGMSEVSRLGPHTEWALTGQNRCCSTRAGWTPGAGTTRELVRHADAQPWSRPTGRGAQSSVLTRLPGDSEAVASLRTTSLGHQRSRTHLPSKQELPAFLLLKCHFVCVSI